MRSTVFEASIVWSVERTRWPVSAASSGDLDGFVVAHLADQNDFRRLAQGRAQGQSETRRVAVQLALMDRRFLVAVQELDRVFDGQDVIGLFSLIRSMIAASVEDFPEPVGPVTSTMPFRRSAISPNWGGRLSLEIRDRLRNDAHDDRGLPRCRKIFTRKPRRPAGCRKGRQILPSRVYRPRVHSSPAGPPRCAG